MHENGRAALSLAVIGPPPNDRSVDWRAKMGLQCWLKSDTSRVRSSQECGVTGFCRISPVIEES